MSASARSVALRALTRIERDGAYANRVLPALLDSAPLSEQDRGFVTELVYGTTRMRRACDWLIDRALERDVEPVVRTALRLGVYQLVYLRTPAHAAVAETVEVVPRRARGLVNAVLRRVARDGAPGWPDDATRLSYPDWIVLALVHALGPERALAALERMNRPPAVTARADGYVQDLASQWVAAYVGARRGERVADLCAAPGGKATAIASTGAFVAASDVHLGRARLVRDNVRRLGRSSVSALAADARYPPLRRGAFERVLVDAPCTGLGVLRRRPDARWRIRPDDVSDLVCLQRDLIEAAVPLLCPGGTLVYSVCTLTTEETQGIDHWLTGAHPELEAMAPPDEAWIPWGRGGLLLPQAADTDGMFVLAARKVG